MVGRAAWVWGRPEPADLVAWARREELAELFVGVRADLATSGDLAWVRAVVQLARGDGIRVAALGGDPCWLERPEDALDWARAVVAPGLFDGVHVDLEPWAHCDWDTRRAELVTTYLDILGRLASTCPLPIEVDLAFWLDRVRTPAGEPLDRAAMRLADAVTVLSFRNTAVGPDSITAVAAAALTSAGRAGIPCRLGVETNYLGPEPEHRKQTFYGLGRAALSAALEAVEEVESGVEAFVGMAVQDHEGWLALRD